MKHVRFTLTLLLLISLIGPAVAQEATPSPDLSALVLPADASVSLAQSDVVTTFDEGAFPESVVVDADGFLYVTLLSPMTGSGQIWRGTADGRGNTFAEVMGGNLVFHPDGTLYATVQSGDFLNDPGSVQTSLVRFTDEGVMEELLVFPQGSSPNGITFDPQGILYSADSALGLIWRVLPDTVEAEVWLENPLLLPQGPQGIPGANGIKVFEGAVYTVNSSSGDFLRIPVGDTGEAGEPEIVATGVTGDGFVFDAEGYAYVTTHPFNTLVRVSPQGELVIIGNAENGVIGATDAAFGRLEGDTTSLYVVQDGGLFTQLIPPAMLEMFPETSRTDFTAPSLIRLDVRGTLP